MRRIPRCWARVHRAVLECAGVGFALGCLGCPAASNPSERPDTSAAGDHASGDELASVAGVPVTASDVRAEMKKTSLTPRQALEAAVARRVLLNEAEKQHFGDLPAVQRAGDRQAVRELLRQDVERHIPEDSITEAVLRGVYEREEERFVRGERRTVTQLLFPLPSGASPEDETQALATASEVIAQVQKGEPQAIFETWVSSSVKLEELGTFSREAPFVEPFLEAAFSRAEPGIVESGIRTQFGVHVIWVKAIQPASRLTFSEVRARLTMELLLRKREARLAELVEAARRRFVPESNPEILSALGDVEADPSSRTAP